VRLEVGANILGWEKQMASLEIVNIWWWLLWWTDLKGFDTRRGRVTIYVSFSPRKAPFISLSPKKFNWHI